jgi:release factor glutamine methyltransferase
MPRLKLYLNFDRVLTDAELAPLRELVKRRGAREPLQYLVGSASFCGLELQVTPAVLIPRPETELLAERAWTFLKGASGAGGPPTALDFGTGSGCLALALAVQCPAAMVHAVDISEAALGVARGNAERHAVGSRIQFHLGDGFAVVPSGSTFDLIVANPPYIPAGEIPTLEPEVRDHEPRGALDGGADGLDLVRRLSAEGGRWLKPGGRLMLEFGHGQAGVARDRFTADGWVDVTVENDLTRRPRMLIAGRCDA